MVVGVFPDLKMMLIMHDRGVWDTRHYALPYRFALAESWLSSS